MTMTIGRKEHTKKDFDLNIKEFAKDYDREFPNKAAGSPTQQQPVDKGVNAGPVQAQRDSDKAWEDYCAQHDFLD